MANGWGDHREIGFGRITPSVKWLLIVTIGLYFAQDVIDRGLVGAPFTRWFALSLDGLRHGRIWQLVTYMFLHGPLFHLLLNMLLLFMIGPETERRMGRNPFLTMYFLSGILGGLGWLLISAANQPMAFCVGASGAIFGIIGAFAAFFPYREITVLLFFVVPLRLKAWVLAAGLAAIEGIFLLTHPESSIANAAHLAGGLAGFVYAREMARRERTGGTVIRFPQPARRFGRRRPSKDETEEASREIDRILDKMHREGIGSLTAAERKALERHSRRLRGE